MSTEPKFNRRQFLSAAGIAGLGLGMAACSPGTPPPPAPKVVDSGMGGTPSAVDSQSGPTPEEMDVAHKKVVDEYLANLAANNKIFWPPKMPFKMDGDTKVFEITCQDIEWETRPGEKLKAQAYNGIVPGPEIRVTEGDKLRFIVKNMMTESTTIHWHGVHVPNAMDGVGYVNQPTVIRKGETYTYEFVAKNTGSHMYHSHHNAAEQVTKGLLGAFIIEPKDKSKEPKFDSDYTMILNDTNIGLTINGRSFPGTGAIVAKLGEKVRVRFMNEGMLIHPMHLHGFWMQVITKDGATLPAPYMADVLNVAPGERYDVIIDCNAAGPWAFHCHILTHAESARGMFGMVTALVVQ